MGNKSSGANSHDAHLDSQGMAMSRREALSLLGAGTLVATLPGCGPSAPTASGSLILAEPIYYSSVRALAQAIRNGEVLSEEVVQACLDRIDRVNGALNAVVQVQHEAAITRAREADAALAQGESWGALHGVPMTIKDSLDTAGVISTGGTKGREAFVPDRDATVVSRVRGAGAILLGKTNTPELTLSFETDNLVYGLTNNPFDLERSPGGSSGGAAAIIAAAGSPFDIGSDYGGSIRLPSHFCGIAGIKPSAGRVPRTGHIYPFGGIQDSFQQIGPLARHVDDLVLVLELIAGPDAIDPGVAPLQWRDEKAVDLGGLRVSFHNDNGIATPTAETRQTVERVAQRLESAVSLVEEVRPTGVEQSFDLFALYRWDGGAAASRLLRKAGTTEPSRSFGGPALGAAELDELVARWYSFRSEMHSFMADYDAIVCPVNATPARMHGPDMDDLTGFSYTWAYNLTGWPGAVVRAGTSPEGLPIGVQIVAGPGREDVAFALAKFVETEFGGYQRPAL
jgi:amidase